MRCTEKVFLRGKQVPAENKNAGEANSKRWEETSLRCSRVRLREHPANSCLFKSKTSGKDWTGNHDLRVTAIHRYGHIHISVVECFQDGPSCLTKKSKSKTVASLSA